MKKASNVRLSLRKLCIAMMAVGPIAVLPSPLLAAIPGTAPYSVTNGSAIWSPSGASATIQSSDKAVLVWNNAAFNIAAGETFNFTLPSGGAVLNKVGYATTGALAAADNAIINGTLFSTGRVFVLANGNILIGDGANITTIGGLVLSTVQESSDFSFTTAGTLTYTGSSLGSVTIGAPTLAIIAPQISGNLDARAGSIVSNRASITGDAVLRTVTANTGIDVSAVGPLSVTGALSVITANGSISGTNAVTSGGAAGNQTASFSTGATGNASITLTNAGNGFEFLSLTTGAGGNATVIEATDVTLSTSSVGGNLDLVAAGVANAAGISTDGVVAVTGTSNFATTIANSTITIANSSVLTGAVTAATNNAAVSITTNGAMTVGGVNTGTGNRGGVTLNSGTGALTLAGAIVVTSNANATTNVALTGTTITQSAPITLTTTNTTSSVNYNATNGGIAINAPTTSSRVIANTGATGGAITQTAPITTTLASVTSTFNSGTGSIALTDAGNAFVANQTIQLRGGTVALTNTNDTVIGTTNTTGNLSIILPNANTSLNFGTGSGTDAQNITVTGTLFATTTGTGTITDGDYTAFNIFGGMNLTTGGGNVVLDAATANGGLAPNVQFGLVNINAGTGTVSVAESTSLNLGTINATNMLMARSVGGGIIDSGTITLSGVMPSATFNVSSSQSVVLDNGGHTLGAVNIIGGTGHSLSLGTTTRLGNATSVPGDLSITTPGGSGVILGDTLGGTVSVGNLTVNSGGTILVDGGVLVTGTANLVAGDTTANSITDTATTGRLSVMGVTTLASSGNVTLDTGHDFSSLVLNGVTGNLAVRDINNVTISGNASAAVEVRAGNGTGAIAAPWNLILGNLNAGSLDAYAQDAGGGISGTITQASGTSMHIENTAAFTTDDANIIIGNNGNSFGRVQVNSATSSSRTVTVVEDGTMKVGNVNSRGTTTLTSRFGSIIEDTLNNVNVTNNGTLNLNAVNGSVLIGNTTHTVGTTTGNTTTININAPSGAAAVISNNQITLGNVNANTLTVTTTGGRGNITQSQAAKVFGSATFVAAGNIALTNSANNFGRVALTTSSGAANITVTEGGTLNLGTVSMPALSTGNFIATSSSGDIIDTGLGGVRPGGAIAGSGNGTVTLSAMSGNILLDDPTSDFPTTMGVVFNAQNVTLSPLGQATLVLGANGTSSVAGNLTASSALGNITNAGDLNIAGALWVQTPNNISLNQSGNRFGSVRFSGNQVSISQVNDMNIVRGSTAIGPAALASTGSYVTIDPSGSGVVTFGNTVAISASSSITLPDFFQAAGQLSVNAAGTKDLSALSKSGDLGNLDPINLGTGTYIPPQP